MNDHYSTHIHTEVPDEAHGLTLHNVANAITVEPSEFGAGTYINLSDERLPGAFLGIWLTPEQARAVRDVLDTHTRASERFGILAPRTDVDPSSNVLPGPEAGIAAVHGHEHVPALEGDSVYGAIVQVIGNSEEAPEPGDVIGPHPIPVGRSVRVVSDADYLRDGSYLVADPEFGEWYVRCDDLA